MYRHARIYRSRSQPYLAFPFAFAFVCFLVYSTSRIDIDYLAPALPCLHNTYTSYERDKKKIIKRLIAHDINPKTKKTRNPPRFKQKTKKKQRRFTSHDIQESHSQEQHQRQIRRSSGGGDRAAGCDYGWRRRRCGACCVWGGRGLFVCLLDIYMWGGVFLRVAYG